MRNSPSCVPPSDGSSVMDSTIAAPAFVIPATTSLQEARPRILKQGDTFAVFDQNGDAIATPGSTHGIYHHDTRYLSHLHLTINGTRPILLSATLRDDNSILTCDLANPDLLDVTGRLAVAHDLIHVRRSRFLWQGTAYERISIRNFDTVTLAFRIDLSFAADFADLFEVRGSTRPRHGTSHAPDIGPDHVTLGYTGLDDKARHTTLRFHPAPTGLTA